MFLDQSELLLQVLTMFEKADAEFAELSQKKQILHLDKDKIEKVRCEHPCITASGDT